MSEMAEVEFGDLVEMIFRHNHGELWYLSLPSGLLRSQCSDFRVLEETAPRRPLSIRYIVYSDLETSALGRGSQC